jgi:hypothetical protein
MPKPSPTSAHAGSKRTYRACYIREWLALNPKLKQHQLAEFTDYAKGYVSEIARGRKPWNQDFMEKAVEFFRANGFPQMTIGDLIDVDPSDPEQFELYMQARRIPADKRIVAADVLRGMNEGRRSEGFTARPESGRVR